jgi:hypothetical protein
MNSGEFVRGLGSESLPLRINIVKSVAEGVKSVDEGVKSVAEGVNLAFKQIESVINEALVSTKLLLGLVESLVE